ncbi:hypothetical protein, partial [Mycobacterium tuberculosis]|uniref:hypothetical protein n=1 Tax=Mycobacterium tuberculosis TaxID=1773 RepID=UPI001BFF60B8
MAFLDLSFSSGCGAPPFGAPGQLRPPYLAESPELHPTDNLAGTAAATSILRKFDTNTEAATANQSIMFIA